MNGDIWQQLNDVSSQWHFEDKSANFMNLVADYDRQIKQKLKFGQKPIVFLAERRYDRFIAGFFACVINEVCLFLINSDWQLHEWEQIEKLVSPDIIFGQINYSFQLLANKVPRFTGIMIATGGTSGKIKFAIHTWQTLTASAESFHCFFDSVPLHFYSCLPLYHVSGLMPVIRSFVSRGKLFVSSFHYLKNNRSINDNYNDYFISFVPTQLQFFLDKQPDFLTKFKLILLGGAAISPQQLSFCLKYKIPLALTYGMTETASGVTILKPQDLSKNLNTVGQNLPHAKIFIDPQKKGIIKIRTSSLFKGYYPHVKDNNILTTDDIGYLDNQGYLSVLGRNSQKIITGGKNVFPLEVEKEILRTNLVKDVYVTGVKDDYWGEVVTVFYVPQNDTITSEEIQRQLAEYISKYKIPKLWHKVDRIPRNQQGKIMSNFVNCYQDSHLN